MANPDLQDKFAYRAECLDQDEFMTSQLNTAAWWHKMQAEVGPEAMIAAVLSGCDGVQVTSKEETVYFYIRLGNLKAPWCFDVQHTYCIAVMPDLHQSDGTYQDNDAYQRARLELFHEAIKFMFKNFNEASHRYPYPRRLMTLICVTYSMQRHCIVVTCQTKFVTCQISIVTCHSYVVTCHITGMSCHTSSF